MNFDSLAPVLAHLAQNINIIYIIFLLFIIIINSKEIMKIFIHHLSTENLPYLTNAETK